LDGAASNPASASVTLADYGLSGSFSVRRASLGGDAALAPASAAAPYPISITLAPREIVMVEFTP
ncbi:MAG: hypothetical protein K8I02_04320, partial [Candidatus Methylomirabilis sp.]|nr:hypothetical protein [Deltaproteobacteria bacterium]